MNTFFQAILAFLARILQSRKFWASAAASGPFAAAGDWHGFSLVWVAYAGIQGAVDGMTGLGAKKPTQPVSVNPPASQDPIPDGVPENLDPEVTSPMDLPESTIKTQPPKETE